MIKYICYFIVFLTSSVFANTFGLDFGNEGGSISGRIVQIFILFAVLGIAPSIIITVTSFTRLVVVFSLLRNALGLQQSPPNMIMLSLAMFLTTFIMEPVWKPIYDNGIKPLLENKIDEKEAFTRISVPVKDFMLKNVREKDLDLFVTIMHSNQTKEEIKEGKESLRALIPAFMISELKRAFEIGFLLFIPFLVIDMVVASILMSLGMMMLPPVMIALPFKLVFFVLIDGWYLLCGSLIRSFKT